MDPFLLPPPKDGSLWQMVESRVDGPLHARTTSRTIVPSPSPSPSPPLLAAQPVMTHTPGSSSRQARATAEQVQSSHHPHPEAGLSVTTQLPSSCTALDPTSPPGTTHHSQTLRALEGVDDGAQGSAYPPASAFLSPLTVQSHWSPDTPSEAEHTFTEDTVESPEQGHRHSLCSLTTSNLDMNQPIQSADQPVSQQPVSRQSTDQQSVSQQNVMACPTNIHVNVNHVSLHPGHNPFQTMSRQPDIAMMPPIAAVADPDTLFPTPPRENLADDTTGSPHFGVGFWFDFVEDEFDTSSSSPLHEPASLLDPPKTHMTHYSRPFPPQNSTSSSTNPWTANAHTHSPANAPANARTSTHMNASTHTNTCPARTNPFQPTHTIAPINHTHLPTHQPNKPAHPPQASDLTREFSFGHGQDVLCPASKPTRKPSDVVVTLHHTMSSGTGLRKKPVPPKASPFLRGTPLLSQHRHSQHPSQNHHPQNHHSQHHQPQNPIFSLSSFFFPQATDVISEEQEDSCTRQNTPVSLHNTTPTNPLSSRETHPPVSPTFSVQPTLHGSPLPGSAKIEATASSPEPSPNPPPYSPPRPRPMFTSAPPGHAAHRGAADNRCGGHDHDHGVFPQPPTRAIYGLDASGGAHSPLTEVPLTPRLYGTVPVSSGAFVADREGQRAWHEKEDAMGRKLTNLWRGRGCMPDRGCYGRSGREGRKRRRWWCTGICAAVWVVILIVAIAVPLTVLRNRKAKAAAAVTGPTISFVNLTSFPPMPTGKLSVVAPANSVSKSDCTYLRTVWSCSLPPEFEQEVAPFERNQPIIPFEIEYDDSPAQAWNVENPAPPTPTPNPPQQTANFGGDGEASTATPIVEEANDTEGTTAAVSVRATEPGRFRLRKRQDTFSPKPRPPSYADMWFLGNTTDGIVAEEKAGEPTPFYISLLGSLNDTVTGGGGGGFEPEDDADKDGTVASLRGTIRLPFPDLTDEGVGARARLLPRVRQQPLRLYDRGLPTEHYAFYTYFRRTLYTRSVNINKSHGIVAYDENGGTTVAEGKFLATWGETRLHVQIWTKRDRDAKSNNNNNNKNRAWTPLASTTAVDARGAVDVWASQQPGTMPYPVTVRLDTHGGDPSKKYVWSWPMDERHGIDTSKTSFLANDISAGGAVVNPRSDENQSFGGFDGGQGGCQCQWTNFS